MGSPTIDRTDASPTNSLDLRSQPTSTGPLSYADRPGDRPQEPGAAALSAAGPRDPGAGRARWPVFGLLAAVNGFVSSMMILGSGITEEDAQQGVGVIEKLERGNFRIGSILGMAAVGLLFVTVAAWRRWLERIAPDDLAARTIPTALAGIPILNVFFVSMAATMVLYLPGGTDHGWLSDEALFVNFTMLDFGPLLGWWGAMVAAIALSVLAFGSNPAVPRWMGFFSLAMLVVPVGLFVGIGLPGMVGLFGPVWLAVISIGQIVGSSARH